VSGVRSLFWLPMRLLWALVRVMALPTVLVVVAWWLLPDRWAQAVTAVALVYLAGMAVLAGAQLRGRVRSMARGSFTIRDEVRRWNR
jgi:hypothetical protein